jgi:L-threonylcarbamoyladenylate synthase
LTDDVVDRDRGPVRFAASAPQSIEMAAEMIHRGGVVAIPTDTVYGIAASTLRIEALERIYAIKHRDRSKPIPLLVSSMEALERAVLSVDPDIALLLDRFWPGALTMAFPAPNGTPKPLLAEDGSVGVRMPNHRLALELIERSGGIVACTSANISGSDPATSADEVQAALGDLLDGIVDGGRALGGVPSTVAGIADGELVIFREGSIPAVDLLSAWREIRA